jgi:hypothetical protein
MKRFIDLGNQTGNIDFKRGQREFAFYCTVRDVFESFNTTQTWSSVEDFISDYEEDGGTELERFLGLIPDEFKPTLYVSVE